jgi:hypothetical protein
MTGRPSGHLTEDGEALFEAYRWMKNAGVLPVEGGFYQQPWRFVQSADFCDSVHAAYASVRRQADRDHSKLQANLAKMGRKRAGR